MTWTYGETLCIEPHIPVGDWVYGETLCTTLATVVYPTLAWVRVTSLIHRWSPGLYSLTLGLGELTTDFVIPDVISRPPPALGVMPEPGPPMPPVPPLPPMPECIEGNYTCVGDDKYVCFEGRWRLAEKNAPECAGGGCLEGSYECRGADLHVCFEGRWRLAEENSPRCGGVPPTPTPPVPPAPPPAPPAPPEPPIPPIDPTLPPGPMPPTPTPPTPTPPVTGCTYEGITYSPGAYVCMGRDKYVCFERMWRLARKNAPECGGGI